MRFHADIALRVPELQSFPRGTVIKNPLANAGDMALIPGSGRSPGEGNGNAWRIPWIEESGELQSIGSQESQT